MNINFIETPYAKLWNGDCISGMRTFIPEASIDLILADPPYGIGGDRLDVHYNRDERFALEGYVEVKPQDYPTFTRAWITESTRVLKPGGAIFVFSGWSHLSTVLQALSETQLIEINHLIWHYPFGVYTNRKFVTSHYHILYWVKPPLTKATFDSKARFLDPTDSYRDRQDVLYIPRQNKPGQIKNKNQLPEPLLERIIAYTTKPGHVVLDPFMGSFSTARVAIRMGCFVIGFELNPYAFNTFAPGIAHIQPQPRPAPIAPDPLELARRTRIRQNRHLRRTQNKHLSP